MKPFSHTIICDTETPVSLYAKLARSEAYSFLLESVEPHQTLGRFSIIGFQTQKLHTFPAAEEQNPFATLQKAFEEISYEPDTNLPRIQAPFIGYFAYEAARHIEKLNLPLSPKELPESIFYLPKYLLVYDHYQHTLCLIAYSENDLEELKRRVEGLKTATGPAVIQQMTAREKRPAQGNPNFESLVEQAKERIAAGELLQIVLSQKFEQETEEAPIDLYRRLRLLSPSPYLYFLNFPEFSIIGSSPETLVRTEDDEVILRPIAGTRRRGKTPEEDKKMEDELRESSKEQAEHMMLLDLARHEMGAVAVPGTIRVTNRMTVEKYSHVMHMVSEIRGTKLPQKSLFDIFKTAFPAGTLTGAPKIRAMEIIAEMENEPRGIYGGAVGYFDLSGNMDFAIAIRTMAYKNGNSGRSPQITLRAGAGIVYDSTPAQESLECRNKAAAPLSTLP